MPLIDALPTALGAAAVLPALMLLWLVVAIDRRPERPGLVWLAVLLGIAALFAARWLEVPFTPVLHRIDQPWLAAAARALFVAAIPEETAKVAVIGILVMRLRAAHGRMDALVYGAAVGLGFAAWENLGYLVHHRDVWEALAVVRDLVTVPFHAALGIIAGAWLGAARFGGALGAHRLGSRGALIGVAWLVPVLLHTAFDTPLLALRAGLVAGAAAHLLQALGLAIGVGTALAAAWSIDRIAARQRVHPAAAFGPAGIWGRIGGLLFGGVTAVFAGAVLLGAEADRWLRSGGVAPPAAALGVALLAGGAALYWRSRGRLLAEGART